MKKFYLSILALGSITFSVNGQVKSHVVNSPLLSAHHELTAQDNSVVLAPMVQFVFPKAAGDIIFSDDFATGISAWTASGLNGNIWAHDTDGPNGQYSSAATQTINSTTSADGFAMFDADLNNPGSAPFINWVGSLESPAMDLTGLANVIITFEQCYRTCCTSTFYPKVEVSDDDFATMTEFDVSIPGIFANDVSPTYTTKLNLSDFLAGASTPANVKFRFTWDGAAGDSHYYWQVDDVVVFESYDNDITALSNIMVSGTLEIPYYNVALSQLTDISFSGQVRNDGGMSSTNVVLDVNVDNGGGTFSSTGVTVPATAIDSLVTTTFLPGATGPLTYNVSYDYSMTETDPIPSDNSLTDAFDITVDEYSVHNDDPTGSIGALSGEAGQPLKIGNIMEIMADDRIGAVYVRPNNEASNVGQDIYAEIYYWDGVAQDYVFLQTTETITISATNNGQRIELPMAVPVNVVAGDELLVVACHYGNPIENVRFALAQEVEVGIVAGYDATGDLFGLVNPRAVMVGLKFDPTASIDVAEDLFGINVHPNPADDKFLVTYNTSDVSEVTLTLTDLTGKEISSRVESGQSGAYQVSVDVADLNAGVYLVTIDNGISTVTKRVIVK